MLYFANSRLLLFEKLHEIDRTATSLARNVLAALQESSKFQNIQNDGELDNIAIAGSTCEGGMLARIFYPINGYVSREVETDLEFILLDIPASHKNIVEDIPDKKAFAKMCIEDELLWKFSIKSNWDVYKKHFEERRHVICQTGYFKPNVMKETLKVNLDINSSPIRQLNAMTFFSAFTKGKITLKYNTPKITKATVQGDLDIYSDEKLISNVAWDISALIRINWWPDVANEWVFRKRNWPSKTVINDLTKISYLITKSSVHPSSENDTSELRYSFAHLERELISRRSLDQEYIYLIFKSMFYKWIKPIDSETICSFIAKTVMFWVCEEYPPKNRMWRKKSCIRTLNYLFCQLLSALEENHLPYYFTPSINVIEAINDKSRIKMISVVKEILYNTEKFVPNNVDEVIEISQEMLNIAMSVNLVLNCYELLRRSLKLFVKTIEVSQRILNMKTSDKRFFCCVEKCRPMQHLNDRPLKTFVLYTTAAFYFLFNVSF